MMRFAGKRILVTGSTRGIGHATALRLLEEGATVILHGRTMDAVRRVLEPLRAIHGIRVTGEAADLGDRTQCRSLCRALTDVDVLINCAGVLESQSLANSSPGHWHRIMDINTTAPWILARELLPQLRARQGVIVNVSSDAGLLGYADHSVYCASKGALIGLTRALAVELAPDVRVICVCPGPVDTDMMQNAVRSDPEPEATLAAWRSLTLLGRVARSDEIAAAVAFAASADCSFATGNLIVVDGGATAGRRVQPLTLDCDKDESLKARAGMMERLRRRCGLDYNVMKPAEIARYMTGVSDQFPGAIFTKEDGHANPMKLLRAFHAALEPRAFN